MRTIEALELEPEDYESRERRDKAVIAMAHAELVIYRGDIVKNTSGKITRRLSDIQSQERRAGARVY